MIFLAGLWIPGPGGQLPEPKIWTPAQKTHKNQWFSNMFNCEIHFTLENVMPNEFQERFY